MSPPRSHEQGGLPLTEQIERYRTAFIAVVAMVLIAAATGGYILAHENLKLPNWVPVLGKSYFTLKAEFQTAQALTPGQGQAVTIAGAKIGEISTVELQNGVAVVSMKVTPKYAHYIYKDATLLMRPKTSLQDMTVEVNPGTPAAGRLRSGEVIPQSQTAANVDFDELLAGLDADTRAYLQELLAGLGEGLKENGKALSATFKRFSPTARLLQEISQELKTRHVEIARSIHNFRLLTEAIGGKDTQLAQLIQASNSVFATFAAEDSNFQRTLQLLPGALRKTAVGIGKLGAASDVVGPTLHALTPFARALAPAQEATKRSVETTTPIIQNQIRPFARKIQPVLNSFAPDTRQLVEAFPKLARSFSVLNEFFNELAYNPGPSKGGFMFFLGWQNHNFNSVLSQTDAHGPLGRTLLYFNCNVAPLLTPVAKVNPTINLIVGLLNPPNKATCQSQGLLGGAAAAGARTARAAGRSSAGTGLSELSSDVFGQSSYQLARLPSASGEGGGG
jgi:phospholipid/cholesterol/gamma-HCH transport system substrate-binding protein